MASYALADNYDPSSVILLKHNDNGGLKTIQQKIDESKQRQEQQKKNPDNGLNNPNIILPESNPTPTVTVTKNKTSSTDAQLTSAYASLVYMSVCSDKYRDELAPKTEKNLDTQRMWADIQTSCKCLTDQILAQVQPADLTDYVMYNYGQHNPSDDDLDDDVYSEFRSSDANKHISDMSVNPDIRAKCGFLK